MNLLLRPHAQTRLREFDAADTVSQAVFLQRIAHPEISYRFGHEGTLMMVGDKRQLSQALTNALEKCAGSSFGK